MPSKSVNFDQDGVPEWHAGNIYAIENVPQATFRLPQLPLNETSTFDVFISGDYEVNFLLYLTKNEY